MTIYHIVSPEIWDKFKNEAFYEAESLGAEGFIHCSFAKQIDGVFGALLQRRSEGLDFDD